MLLKNRVWGASPWKSSLLTLAATSWLVTDKAKQILTIYFGTNGANIRNDSRSTSIFHGKMSVIKSVLPRKVADSIKPLLKRIHITMKYRDSSVISSAYTRGRVVCSLKFSTARLSGGSLNNYEQPKAGSANLLQPYIELLWINISARHCQSQNGRPWLDK